MNNEIHGNGNAKVPHSKVLSDILPYCEANGITICINALYHIDVCGDPMKYNLILKKDKKKLGIFIQSQTISGSAEKKIFHWALSLLANTSFQTILMPIGQGWSRKIVSAASKYCSIVLEDDIITYLEGFFQ